ncbi:WG repeat-containing protein [Salinisphaera sp. SPP-AMP-43]|uniref:WG repeat-containing protein n=1 Tax=Salinisphaera sp. SPP-AMP-43 TaxID=3121288 RepID=UPI003C6E7215
MLKPNCRRARYRGVLFLLLAGCGLTHLGQAADSPASLASRLLPICVHEHMQSRCGLLQRDGQWAVTPRYEALYVRDDGWRFERDGKSGLLHTDGSPWLDAKYQTIGAFHHGYAPAGKRWTQKGFIDRRGHWVIAPKYASTGPLVDGRAPVCRSDDGQRRCHYIDRDGGIAFDGEYAKAGVFKYGMAVIQPVGSNTISTRGRRVGLIDREGHTLIEPASRNALHILGPDRVLEASRDRYALIDPSDKTLFEVAHDGLLMSAGAGLLAYRPTPSSGIGLRRIATDEVVVAPDNGYATRPRFAHGTSTVLAAGAAQGPRVMLIDPRGQILIQPGHYQGIGPFFDGVGPVSIERGHWQLVNINGKTVTNADYARLEPAWKSAKQTHRVGDVWAATPADAVSDRIWIDSRGTTLARREALDCGTEIVRNGAGAIIWPSELDADCRAGDT